MQFHANSPTEEKESRSKIFFIKKNVVRQRQDKVIFIVFTPFPGASIFGLQTKKCECDEFSCTRRLRFFRFFAKFVSTVLGGVWAKRNSEWIKYFNFACSQNVIANCSKLHFYFIAFSWERTEQVQCELEPAHACKQQANSSTCANFHLHRFTMQKAGEWDFVEFGSFWHFARGCCSARINYDEQRRDAPVSQR